MVLNGNSQKNEAASNLICLIDWHEAQCAEWKKNHKIMLTTIDNPGWFIRINLIGTDCENKYFKEIDIQLDEMNWYICYVRDGSFEGAGGPNFLSKILEIFCEWAKN